MKRFTVAALAALSLSLSFSASVQAAEVAGVHFEDKTRIGASELAINGTGLRTKIFIKVYAAALYLPEKQGDANAAIAAKGTKRIAISLLRDLSAQQFVDALQEGIAKNSSDAEAAALKDRLAQFSEAMLSIGEARKGTIVMLDWLPETGTRLTVAGQQKGKDIAGEDFYRALMKIWLGAKPVQDDLKQGLLGKAS